MRSEYFARAKKFINNNNDTINSKKIGNEANQISCWCKLVVHSYKPTGRIIWGGQIELRSSNSSCEQAKSRNSMTSATDRDAPLKPFDRNERCINLSQIVSGWFIFIIMLYKNNLFMYSNTIMCVQ